MDILAENVSNMDEFAVNAHDHHDKIISPVSFNVLYVLKREVISTKRRKE